MDFGGKYVNHLIATYLSVSRKAQHLIGSEIATRYMDERDASKCFRGLALNHTCPFPEGV